MQGKERVFMRAGRLAGEKNKQRDNLCVKGRPRKHAFRFQEEKKKTGKVSTEANCKNGERKRNTSDTWKIC